MRYFIAKCGAETSTIIGLGKDNQVYEFSEVSAIEKEESLPAPSDIDEVLEKSRREKAGRTPPKKSAKAEKTIQVAGHSFEEFKSPTVQKKERNEKILKDYHAGADTKELADRYDMSGMNILKILKKGGVKFTKGKKKSKQAPIEYPKPEEAEAPTNRAPVPFDDEDLTEDQKAEILEKFNEGLPPSVNTPTLAKEYGVSIKTIWGVIRNRPK